MPDTTCGSRSPRVDVEELEDLADELIACHAELIAEVFERRTRRALPDDIIEAARAAAGRITALLALLDDELEDPELTGDQLASGADDVLDEIEDLKIRVRDMVARARSHER